MPPPTGGRGLTGPGLARPCLAGPGLSGAGLSGAGLSGAGLSGAGLSGAGLSGAGLAKPCLAGPRPTDPCLADPCLSRPWPTAVDLSRPCLAGASLSGPGPAAPCLAGPGLCGGPCAVLGAGRTAGAWSGARGSGRRAARGGEHGAGRSRERGAAGGGRGRGHRKGARVRRARLPPRYGAGRARRRAQHDLRHDEDGLHPAVDVGLQPDGDAVAAGELGDDVQADAAVGEQAGDVDLVGVGEQRVHPGLFADGHAEAAVLDLHGQPRGDEAGAQQHLGVRGGEHRGVLDQFREQVDDVGHGVAAQFAVDGRHQLDPGVLLDLGDGRAQHLGHGDRVAPLPAGDGAAEHGEVLRVPPDAGGQVVDVEEALEQVRVLDLVLQVVQDGDLPVHQGLQSPGEVDEDLQLLLAARLAGELGGLHDGGDGAVVRAGQLGGEQVEVVGVLGRRLARSAPRRGLAAAQRLDEGAQVGLAPGGAAAQGADPVADEAGGAVRGHGGDQDGRGGHRGRPGEHGPQGGSGVRAGGADAEDDGRARAEGHRRRREHGEPHELGPYVRLGQCGSGSGDRTSVPAALTAVCAGGRCTEVRHLRPRTGPSGCHPDTDSSRPRIMCGGQLTKSPVQGPALV
ncbi:Spidroin-1 [Streptomyces collinus Tu 365]|uniref:Spidroin-1 n=1 Tax=Streptomyces collinus (strain DSM 40733 / Tue 365) TaxID=1214242 RepID=S5VCT0_STRC3|nr:Spidroin-1 [Streptomyces collinus Tu 365]